jgi:hypothetical protein
MFGCPADAVWCGYHCNNRPAQEAMDNGKVLITDNVPVSRAARAAGIVPDVRW